METLRRVVDPGSSETIVLRITDPEVVAELQRHEAPISRTQFALAALRVGVLAIKHAGGALDERAVRDAGREVVSELTNALMQHRERTVGEIATTLKTHLDHDTGTLPAALRELAGPNGRIATLLGSHLTGDGSTLTRTLLAHVGATSPLMKLLSPEQKDGVLARLQDVVKQHLGDQRTELLREFDLNQEGSALARLVRSVSDGHGNLKDAIDKTIGRLTSEFSLDREDSALARLKKEIGASVAQLTADQREFRERVLQDLASIVQRRVVEAVTPQKGATFEDALASLLQCQAQRAQLLFDRVGLQVGKLKNCKKGDFVLELGPESAAPCERIVVEAKHEAGFSLERARSELAEARPNRDAQHGLWVCSPDAAPDGWPPFRRIGEDAFVVWDPADRATDVYVAAAIDVLVALTVRRTRRDEARGDDVASLEHLVAQVEKDAAVLESVRVSAGTIQSSAKGINDTVVKLIDKLGRSVREMKERVEALRGHDAE